MKLNTTIHVMDEDGRCALCKVRLPKCARAGAGEFVGVVTYGGQAPELGQGYRIGTHNKDSLCDGTPYTAFFQASLKNE